MPTVHTNHVPRDVIDAMQLTEAERAQFDYLNWQDMEEGNASASFFRYRGELYDLGGFEVWDNPTSPTREHWDSYRSDSFFSGLVVRYVNNFERVVVGLYMV